MSNCPACATPLAPGATACSLCGFQATEQAGAQHAPGQPPRAPTRPQAPRPPGTLGGARTSPSTFTAPGTGGGAAQAAPQAEPDADPYEGRTIAGKFQVLELLGQGGMGKVYKARHLGLDKTVCIKTLKPALLEDATVVGRFEREAKAASRLNHTNSIQVLDFGQDELGALYIAMEFVSGKDLRKTLRDEFPLGEERICHIMGQVLSALAEAHAQSVIHRDLKPENIMLEQRRGEPDFVKVLDFGIAKIQDPDVPGLTRADVVCGTPLYMSPEQATGSKFDARADLYAIGVILYQLTTGTLPFEGANSMEILTKHVTELPVPPRTRRPEVSISPEMELLILRALDKDPANRPQSADEFRADLLKIRNKLQRAREDAEEAARTAASQHKQDRAQALQARQAAQRAQFGGAQASPKSKAPLFAGLGVAAVLVLGGGFVLLRSPSAPAPAPAPAPAQAPVAERHAEAPAPVPTPAPVAEQPEERAPENKQVARVTAAAQPAEMVNQPVLKRGDARKAGELVDEAELLMEEGDPKKALQLYRDAIAADPSFTRAYRGLVRVGGMVKDVKAVRQGAQGYLRLAPDAPDAVMIRKQLEMMR